MKMGPLVSIVIPCYNKKGFISDAIESALNQTYANIECIVIDDGSMDGSKEVVKRYQNRDDRVQYFYKENSGPSATRNYGTLKARGELIQFLDADDWLNTDKIRCQLQRLPEGSNKKEVVFYSNYKIIDDGDPTSEREFLFGQLEPEKLIEQLIGRRFGLNTPTPLHVNSTLFTKNIFNRYLFNESMRCYEDLLFFYRLLSNDVQFIHTPCTGMYYRSNPGGISKVSDDLRTGYLQFLEAVFSSNKSHMEYAPNIHVLIKHFVKTKNVKMYKRTMALVHNSNVPVYSADGKNIRKSLILLDKLKILYSLLTYQKRLLLNYPKM